MWKRWLAGAALGVLAALVVVKVLPRWLLAAPLPPPPPPLPGEEPFVPERDARELSGAGFCSDSWCWESPRPQGIDLTGVWGSSSKDVWAVGGDCQPGALDATVGGGSGTLLHWDGRAWSSVHVESVAALCAVWGASASDVWVVGADSQGLHWDGAHWSPVAISTQPASFRQLIGRAADDVFALGDSADGAHAFHWDGKAWSAFAPNPPEPFAALAPLGSELLGTTALHGTLEMLERGAWKRRLDRDFPDAAATVLEPSPTGERAWLASSHMVRSKREGPWAVQWEPGVMENPFLALRRYENGLAPQLAQIERPEKPSAIWRLSDRDLWIVGEAGLMLHWDGTTLTRSPAVTGQDLLAVWGSAPDQGWAVGRGGVMLQWDGRAWTRRSSALTDVDLTGLAGTGQELWATGKTGALFRQDGGHWSQLKTGTDADLSAVWESASGQVWAVGEGVTLRWDGKSLTRQHGPKLGDVWGGSERDDDVWALGLRPDDSGSGVARWQNGAWRWQELPPVNGDRRLRRITGSGPKDVWVAGMIGTGEEALPSVLQWSGHSWRELPDSDMGQSYDIQAFAPRDAWICGERGVAHWDGKKWTPHAFGTVPGAASGPTETHEPCRKLLGRSPTDLYALSENLTARSWRLNHWDGKAWTATRLPVPQDAVNAFATSLGKLWIAGSRGALLVHELPAPAP
jgi:hypothetical protein